MVGISINKKWLNKILVFSIIMSIILLSGCVTNPVVPPSDEDQEETKKEEKEGISLISGIKIMKFP